MLVLNGIRKQNNFEGQKWPQNILRDLSDTSYCVLWWCLKIRNGVRYPPSPIPSPFSFLGDPFWNGSNSGIITPPPTEGVFSDTSAMPQENGGEMA